MTEVHLVIVWEHATEKLADILNDIDERFELKKVLRVGWREDLFAQNLTRFYGENLPPNSGKEKHIGNGDFHVVLFVDSNPVHDIRATTKGNLTVNTNVFDSKQRYREWTGGGHKIHGTNTSAESAHDIWLLLGQESETYKNSQKWDGVIQPIQEDLLGADGWKNIDELFFHSESTL